MSHFVAGIHHITAIASDPRKTVDFYTRVLGLRLVKKSVNQDDVSTYHLFFGDKTGEPGMDLTFFTFQPTFPGQRGVGQVTKISFSVPAEALTFWEKRLRDEGIRTEKRITFFGHERLVFYDFDNQRLELVGTEKFDSSFEKNLWTTKQVSSDHAIRSFHSAELTVSNEALIEPVLSRAFGYLLIAAENEGLLFVANNSTRAALIEIKVEPHSARGSTGAGTVHHIAFRVRDAAHQSEIRSLLLELGLQPTPVIERYYFQSVYFRVPAGILFELATDGPGFTADETEKDLGIRLALPPFLEPQRQEIEAGLIPI
jgi:glyoxalase family protein